MTRFLRLSLLPLVCVVLTALASAQMVVSPPGGNVSIGSSIKVSNNGGTTGIVGVCINGQLTVLGAIPPGASQSYGVPNDPSLVGLCVVLKTWQAGKIIPYEFCITA